ncbi:lysis system i-spanin subunit Rz [Pseudomonas paeninsulae]|uniref:lysis system i-spanin subunit Rz n=1 Tax=Pseudomonas paeninsulae TaxID=3110772 RepID=UPI002D789027|nr:lysis system i-spanin subunit Rz [Pseudomonas sp. IT1137]
MAILAQYRLALIAAGVAALMALSAAGAWTWQANAYGKQLAVQSGLHSDTLAEIARASSRMLQAQQEKRQALETQLSALDGQHYQELTHAQQTTDRLAADLAAARQRLSVRTTGNANSNGVPAGAGAASVDDGAERADIHPEDARAIAAITGDADRCAVKLTALQGWVKEVAKGGG